LASIRLGVIADTHIPDRLPCLPAQVREAFRGVKAILHAGDVSRPEVLEDLGRIAPVHAVAGNSDFMHLRLPLDRVVEVGGARIGLTHGHGGWGRYLWQKVQYLAAGYDEGRYVRLACARFQNVEAVVFGHTHRPVLRREAGVLVFNPGSLGPDYYAPYCGPAVGLLHIRAGKVDAEIIRLETVDTPAAQPLVEAGAR
jgi:putative phosphoesterase